MTTSESPPALAIATARLPGVDVARALAVLGMVLVNYKIKMGAATVGPIWLVWLSSLIDGRAAALFVVLAGLGISLRSRRAREHPEELAFERISLLKRAAFLFAAGLLNLHMWEWDILHFYGVYLALAAFLLNVRGWVLWGLAIGCVVVDAVLLDYLYLSTDASLWSLYGMMIELFFEGLHPVFPWMMFLFVGMWLGRKDLSRAGMRRGALAIALGVTFYCAVHDVYTLVAEESLALGKGEAHWTNLIFFLPPQTVEILSATGTAVTALCLCISGVHRRAERRWVAALVATGQLAFTLYIAHAIAILIPFQHGLLENSSLAVSIGYSIAFYIVAVMMCVWWRRRWPYGPLEELIRQITGRTTPAPWGGERLSSHVDVVSR